MIDGTPEVADPLAGGSFGQILRSSSIIGGASVVSIASGIARQKAAALILGPAGVGLIGLFQSLVSVGTGMAQMYVGPSATLELARAKNRDGPEGMSSIRKALLWLTIVQFVIGVTLFWLLRGWLARTVLQDASQATTIGWLTLAIGFGVVSAAQAGLLLGFRRIGDSARITVASALASAIAGIALLYWLGPRAIAMFVILPSACAVVAGFYYVRRLPRPVPVPARFRDMLGQWRAMAGLGVALTAGGSATIIGQLLLRMMIYRQLGDAALGLFQAAATLSMTYIGFILQAMGADYAPRLATAIDDREAANRLVNEQTEVALLLAAPFLLLALGAAPWLFHLFYSSAFIDASAIFRWQVLGDLFKLASWPLGFILIARGEGRTYIFTETAATLILLGLAWVAIPYVGIAASGLAYFGMYILYLPLLYGIAARRMKFRWNTAVFAIFVALAAACGLVAALSLAGETLALAASVALTAGAALLAYNRLGSFLSHAFGRR